MVKYVMVQVISERMKASSMQKLLMEEKDLLHSQIANLAQEKNRYVLLLCVYLYCDNQAMTRRP